MHSVAQYLTPPELDALLRLFHRLLTDEGMLIVGDVLPPDVSAFTDAMALIRFAAANGFLAAALVGLCRTALSDYWRLRSSLGLTRYGDAAMVEKLAAAGFSASRAAANIGHNPARMTFLRKADESGFVDRSGYRIANGCPGLIELTFRQRVLFYSDGRPGGGVATQRPCKVLHPGSIPGRASSLRCFAASAGKPAADISCEAATTGAITRP